VLKFWYEFLVDDQSLTFNGHFKIVQYTPLQYNKVKYLQFQVTSSGS